MKDKYAFQVVLASPGICRLTSKCHVIVYPAHGLHDHQLGQYPFLLTSFDLRIKTLKPQSSGPLYVRKR